MSLQLTIGLRHVQADMGTDIGSTFRCSGKGAAFFKFSYDFTNSDDFSVFILTQPLCRAQMRRDAWDEVGASEPTGRGPPARKRSQQNSHLQVNLGVFMHAALVPCFLFSSVCFTGRCNYN